MKFQETFRLKLKESMRLPLIITAGFYFAFPYYFRIYSYNAGFYRTFRYIFAFNFGCMTWMYANTKTWGGCKPLHDILTQPEPNGKYFRTILKNNFPNNWSLISKQLHDNGFNFKEMNEYSQKEEMPDVTYKWDDSMY